MRLWRLFLYITPRLLSIVVTVFFSVLVLIGLEPGMSRVELMWDLLVALSVLTATILAWKWPDTGGWLFLLIGIFYMRAIFSDAWWNGIVIGGIPLVTGFLFLAEGLMRDRYPDLWAQHIETRMP